MRLVLLLTLLCEFSVPLGAQAPDSLEEGPVQPRWFDDDSSWTGGHSCDGYIKHVLLVGFHSEARPKARRKALAAIEGRLLGRVGSDGYAYRWVARGSTVEALDSLATILEKVPAVELAMQVACGTPARS